LEKHGGVPLIVKACLDRLWELSAWESEGVFRQQPEEKDITAVLENYQHHGPFAIENLNDIDVVAVTLKRYLRHILPDSLIPDDLQDEFLKCVNEIDGVSIGLLNECIKKLPEINRKTLALLMSLLAKIASLSEEKTHEHKTPSPGHNFMTAQNLTIVLQPAIFRLPPETSQMDMIGDTTRKRQEVVKAMIDNYKYLFEVEPPLVIPLPISLSSLS